MTKKRIAILGGGMAGLATAYELTRTPELRARHEVTVYQMGWRLGGKAASGRDEQGRNLEHGLHVWFGHYENAFRLLQEVYAEWTRPAGCPLQEWTDAFKPQDHTGVGVCLDGRWSQVAIDWPRQAGFPGDGQPVSTIWGGVNLLVGWMRDLVLGLRPEVAQAPRKPTSTLLDRDAFFKATRAGLHPGDARRRRAEALANADELSVLHGLELAHLWTTSFRGNPKRFGIGQLEALISLLRGLDAFYRLVSRPFAGDRTVRLIGEALNIFAAILAGIVEDLVRPDKPLEQIDDQDFRAWLLKHGADPEIVASSSLVRVVYDVSFQYSDGDVRRPTCAAGSGLGSVIRILATYKEAMLYEVTTGFGEAVVAPLYQVLLDAHVIFRFFSKVTGLELSADGRRVARVRLARQARVKSEPYRPTFELDGLVCWPSTPFWDQLQDGDRLKAAGVNFESRWCTEPPVGEQVLEDGRHYDWLVLAIAMGGYKPFPGDPGICAELAAASDGFRNFVEKIDIVPTLGVQLWIDRDLQQLGWRTGKSATVSGPEPLDIWADMSQVLEVEPWPADPAPKTLHYFCGSFPTTLYREPPSEAGVPAQAAEDLKRITTEWLNNGVAAWWPNAVTPGGFDWSVLHDPDGRAGVERLEAQFLRANIDPTECCVACAAGQTQYRLHPDQSGFENLTLTGEGTRHGLNATAVEAAVMSGMAASRAICGEPVSIPGFDFLTQPPSRWS